MEVNYRWAEDPAALAMNLNHNQSSVRCLNDTSDNSSCNVERFRAFGAITCPRGVQDLPKHSKKIKLKAPVSKEDAPEIEGAPEIWD